MRQTPTPVLLPREPPPLRSEACAGPTLHVRCRLPAQGWCSGCIAHVQPLCQIVSARTSMATVLRRGRSLKGRMRPPASQVGIVSSDVSTFTCPPLPTCSTPVWPSYLHSAIEVWAGCIRAKEQQGTKEGLCTHAPSRL